MDIRFVLRAMRRRPAASAAVVLAIALSMAITGALFSIVDGLLLRPLPFANPEALVALRYRQAGERPSGFAYLPEFAEARRALRREIESSPMVHSAAQAMPLPFFRPDAQREAGLRVTGVDSQFFRLFGLVPAIGADFTPDDERSPAAADRSLASEVPLPVIVGARLAERLFGDPSAALGVHTMAGRLVRIVGVMPTGVKVPGETNVWAPVPPERFRLPAYVRLRAGVSAAQLAQVSPEIEVRPLSDELHAGGARAIVVLLAAASLLLMLTWVQVAALSLAQAAGQCDEFQIKAALGATRARQMRPALIHNGVIVTGALILAWLAIPGLTAWVIALLPAPLREGQYLDADSRTLIFSAILSVVGLATLMAGPAVLLRRASAGGSVERSYARIRATRARRVLLFAQMTVTAMLLYLAGLALHSFTRATTFDYGFEIQNVLLFTPPSWSIPGASRVAAADAFKAHAVKVQRTIDKLDMHPLVRGVAGFFSAPLGAGLPQELIPLRAFDGRPTVGILVKPNSVGPGFVGTFGARIIAGRPIDRREIGGPRRLLLVNETLARQLMPTPAGAIAPAWPLILGRNIETAVAGGAIIGVVADFVQSAPDQEPQPEFYVFEDDAEAFSGVAVRIKRDDLRSVRAVLERDWGTLSPSQLHWMTDEQDRVLAPYRAQSIMLGLIAWFCLPIAAVGLAGALAESVRARTREIAIRIAVGADARVVRRMIVMYALTPVALGVVAGTAVGSALGSVIARQLFEVRPADATTVVLVASALMGLAWITALAPSARAAAIDPSLALRDS